MSRSRLTWLVAGLGVLLLLAVLLPGQAVLLAGAAAGWALVVIYPSRSRERMEYQKAVRHLHRGEYQQAIRILDALIDVEPDSLEHRRFRANLYRLDGDLNRAKQDCEWIVEHNPGLSYAYMGLAEIVMQQGDYDRALEYMLAARDRDAHDWMITYNLGMIEDRRGHADAAVQYLETTFTSGIRHSHYKLLARLWLARNYHRQGHNDAAQKQLDLMRKQAGGLRNWRLILESEQGAVLRDLLERDVTLARQLIESNATLEVFKQ